MFDIGFWELAVIAVVALIVIGPDKLPEVARAAGKWVGRTRRFVDQVRGDIDREIKQEDIRKYLENEVGLGEIKKALDAKQYKFEEEKDYLVGAINDFKGESGDTPEKQPDIESIASKADEKLADIKSVASKADEKLADIKSVASKADEKLADIKFVVPKAEQSNDDEPSTGLPAADETVVKHERK